MDLTNTDRYYDSLLWQENSINYFKLRCPGQDVISLEKNVEIFNNIIMEFLQKNLHNSKFLKKNFLCLML